MCSTRMKESLKRRTSSGQSPLLATTAAAFDDDVSMSSSIGINSDIGQFDQNDLIDHEDQYDPMTSSVWASICANHLTAVSSDPVMNPFAVETAEDRKSAESRTNPSAVLIGSNCLSTEMHPDSIPSVHFDNDVCDTSNKALHNTIPDITASDATLNSKSVQSQAGVSMQLEAETKPKKARAKKVGSSEKAKKAASIKLKVQKRARTRQKPGLTATGEERKFVQHNYQDRADVEHPDFKDNDESLYDCYTIFSTDSKLATVSISSSQGEIRKTEKRKKVRTAPFPLKLHMMLSHASHNKLDHIVSWLPHGRAFQVHDSKAFADTLMPKFYSTNTIKSFFRQLNLYGFSRLTKGTDEGAYYHEFMLRGKPYLTSHIHRTKIKGTKYRAASNPEEEPDLHTLPVVNVPTNVRQSRKTKTREVKDPKSPLIRRQGGGYVSLNARQKSMKSSSQSKLSTSNSVTLTDSTQKDKKSQTRRVSISCSSIVHQSVSSQPQFSSGVGKKAVSDHDYKDTATDSVLDSISCSIVDCDDLYHQQVLIDRFENWDDTSLQDLQENNEEEDDTQEMRSMLDQSFLGNVLDIGIHTRK